MHCRIRIFGLPISLLMLAACLLEFLPGAQAQSKASCKFQLFRLPNSNPQGDNAYGVNSNGVTVGQAEPNHGSERGFLRVANGSVKYVLAPNSSWSIFTAINDNGVRAGNYIASGSKTGEGFIWSGSKFTPVVDPNSVSPYGTRVTGINRRGTVVGFYTDNKGVTHGFKRTNDGVYVDIDYPGAQSTQAAGINDSGAIVGLYVDYVGGHGFILKNGKWTSIDYPGTQGLTQLRGISNAGVVLGYSTSTEAGFTFLIEIGSYKVISDSRVSGGTFANTIAANGLIAGDVYLQPIIATWHGFIARCK